MNRAGEGIVSAGYGNKKGRVVIAKSQGQGIVRVGCGKKR